MKYKIIKKCQICEKKLFNFLNLGNQPLCDDLSKKPNNNKFYKLQVSYCKDCLTAFQKYNIEKKILFPKTYHYRSANTKDVLWYARFSFKFKKYFSKLKEKTVLILAVTMEAYFHCLKSKDAKHMELSLQVLIKKPKKKDIKYLIVTLIHSSTKIKKNNWKNRYNYFHKCFAHIDDLKNLLLSLKIFVMTILY